MGPHYSNTDFPRLSYLNRAGSNPFAGNKMTHAEAAVSPDYTKFLIATVENNCIGHFTIYNLDTINEKLDEKGNSEDVNLKLSNTKIVLSLIIYMVIIIILL